MKKIMVFILLMMIAAAGFTEKLADLADVLKPKSIAVDGERLYVTGNLTVYMYSLKDFTFIKQFVKKGEGPREAKNFLELTVLPDRLVLNSKGKVMFYTKDGTYMEEKKLPNGISRVLPMGDGFIGRKPYVDAEAKIQYTGVDRFDKEFATLKKLGKDEDHELFRATKGKKQMVMKVIYHSADHAVYKGNGYVTDPLQGYVITVYDGKGAPLHRIDKNEELKKVKVPQSFIDTYLNRLKKLPDWERMNNMFRFVFGDYHPAFYGAPVIVDDKIYFRTYKTRDNEAGKPVERELVVLDLKGKILNRLFAPETAFHSQNCVADNKFYYLVENEDDEQWELHVKGLTP